MRPKFISKERASKLEEAIGWLSNYKTPINEINFIGNSLEDIDKELSKDLKELGDINIRRGELISKIKN